MVDLQGTNPVTGQNVDATNPRMWVSYLIGGTVLVGALMAGKWASSLAADASGVGDTVEDRVLNIT